MFLLLLENSFVNDRSSCIHSEFHDYEYKPHTDRKTRLLMSMASYHLRSSFRLSPQPAHDQRHHGYHC